MLVSLKGLGLMLSRSFHRALSAVVLSHGRRMSLQDAARMITITSL